jgi:hypothetical protein
VVSARRNTVVSDRRMHLYERGLTTCESGVNLGDVQPAKQRRHA